MLSIRLQAYGGTGIGQRFQRLGYDVKSTFVVSLLYFIYIIYCTIAACTSLCICCMSVVTFSDGIMYK